MEVPKTSDSKGRLLLLGCVLCWGPTEPGLKTLFSTSSGIKVTNLGSSNHPGVSFHKFLGGPIKKQQSFLMVFFGNYRLHSSPSNKHWETEAAVGKDLDKHAAEHIAAMPCSPFMSLS